MTEYEVVFFFGFHLFLRLVMVRGGGGEKGMARWMMIEMVN